MPQYCYGLNYGTLNKFKNHIFKWHHGGRTLIIGAQKGGSFISCSFEKYLIQVQ